MQNIYIKSKDLTALSLFCGDFKNALPIVSAKPAIDEYTDENDALQPAEPAIGEAGYFYSGIRVQGKANIDFDPPIEACDPAEALLLVPVWA